MRFCMSMSVNTNVCTYNMGGRINDYIFLKTAEHIRDSSGEINAKKLEACDKQVSIAWRENPKLLEEEYQKVQEEAAKNLISTPTDVFCLQEVGDENRPLIRSLISSGYEVRHVSAKPGEAYYTAIALSSRYTQIENFSERITYRYSSSYSTKMEERAKDVAIVRAYDSLLKQRVVFVSAHITGFNFDELEQQRLMEEGEGNVFCREIADRVARIGGCRFKFVGLDMNGNPEISPERFRIFTSQGFDVQRSSQNTNANPYSAVHLQREIDFVLTSHSVNRVWNWIKSFFVATVIYSHANTTVSSTVRLDSKTNASDHVPVFTRHTMAVDPSSLSRLLRCIAYLFTCCCSKKKSGLSAVPLSK